MNELLKKRLRAVASGGALAVAAVVGAWYEGTGPTVTQPSGEVLYLPYRDPVGIWTVCHGITGVDVVPNKRYSEAECSALEQRHRAVAQASARKLIVGYDKLNVWQQAALIDWIYNVGEGNASTSTLRRKFTVGDIDGGCNELVKWVKGRVNGQLITLPGLVDRRDATKELCLHWGRS